MKRIYKVEMDGTEIVFFKNGGGVRVYKRNEKRAETILKDTRHNVTQIYRTVYIFNR